MRVCVRACVRASVRVCVEGGGGMGCGIPRSVDVLIMLLLSSLMGHVRCLCNRPNSSKCGQSWIRMRLNEMSLLQAVWACLRRSQQTPLAFVESWLYWHFSVMPCKEELERRVGP